MSIGNCPRCGGATEIKNDLCYQCALRRVAEIYSPGERDDVSISKFQVKRPTDSRVPDLEACEHLNSIGQDEYDRYCFDCNRVLVNYDR